MKKFVVIILLLICISCSNTETYYGEEAYIRLCALPTAQAIEYKGDRIRMIYIDVHTSTKYEFLVTDDKKTALDSCVLTVTRNCDVNTELAECKRINALKKD